MKKSVFPTLNYYLPAESVMPMHCSANVGKDGDVALFFGLSGTGQDHGSSADPNRTQIGDDDTAGARPACSTRGRCYAKTRSSSRPRPSRRLPRRPLASAGAGEMSASIPRRAWSIR